MNFLYKNTCTHFSLFTHCPPTVSELCDFHDPTLTCFTFVVFKKCHEPHFICTN